MKQNTIYLALMLVLLCSACAAPAAAPAPTASMEVEPAVATTEPVPTEILPTATATAIARPLSNISADPQRIEFQADDGAQLVGYYYPAKYAEAPVLILMHWAGGNLCDWKDIAPWLQNRADEDPALIERCADAPDSLPSGFESHWWDASWFPAMKPDFSIAVFIFDFRGFGESQNDKSWDNLFRDALAAFEAAAQLDGVNPQRMAALGASIGADGAADGCQLYNMKTGGCLGAFSLSPGSYLGMDYAETARSLEPLAVHCLASSEDKQSAPACEGAGGTNYFTLVYPGNYHGMSLIHPDLDPQPLVLIQDFVGLVFEEAVKE